MVGNKKNFTSMLCPIKIGKVKEKEIEKGEGKKVGEENKGRECNGLLEG